MHGQTVVFSNEQAHQLARVLRLRPGGEVAVLDDRGRQYDVTLQDVRRDHAVGQITGSNAATGEPRANLTLFQSTLRREKFEWVLQKGTELGVARFVPVISARSLVRDSDMLTPERLARWRRIITEAAEQSSRGRLPVIAPTVSFNEAMNDLQYYAKVLIASTRPNEGSVGQALAGAGPEPRVALFIGPEGGFAPDEIELAESRGVSPVTLGPRVLRTETAAIAAAALVLYELGEMEP